MLSMNQGGGMERKKKIAKVGLFLFSFGKCQKSEPPCNLFLLATMMMKEAS
jgi:hypothetical protein